MAGMGLIAPTALFVHAAAGGGRSTSGGWHAVAQGAVLDRPDPALHSCCPLWNLAVRSPTGQNPPDEVMEAAGERQVLQVLHLHLHPVPIRERGSFGRLPVFTASDPELASGLTEALAGLPRSALAAVGGACSAGWASTPLTRWVTRRTSWNAGWPRSLWPQTLLRPLSTIEHKPRPPPSASPPPEESPRRRRFGETFWEFSFFAAPASGAARKSSWEPGGGAALPPGRQESLATGPNDVLNALGDVRGVLRAPLNPRYFGLAASFPTILISAVFGFTLLETVNYLEHYGLAAAESWRGGSLRALVRPSQQLELRPQSSPTCSCTTYSGHSDHHANPDPGATQTLRSMEGAHRTCQERLRVDDRADVLPRRCGRRVMDPTVCLEH